MKRVYKKGLTESEISYAYENGAIERQTQTFRGSFQDCLTKGRELAPVSKSIELKPIDGGLGELTVTVELPLAPAAGGEKMAQQVDLEVEWVQLEQPAETAECFKTMSAAQIKSVKNFLDEKTSDGATTPSDWTPLQSLLFTKLATGVSYVIGYPVIRRTTSNIPWADISNGGAYYRDQPPINITGYQFLKTADSRRKNGSTYSKIEEWTGAKKLDPDFYP